MSHTGAYVPIFIALGSNLGNRAENLNWAAKKISLHPGIEDAEGSPIYESVAHTKKPGEEQPAYLNAVLALKTRLAPLALLAFCLDLEQERGRMRTKDHGWEPRTLDLDVLAYGAMSRTTNRLTIPHPRLHERRFVLRPWNDLEPAFWVPAPFEKHVVDLLNVCPDATKLVRSTDSLLD